jgi:formylglycine-generating enzyme required for sulfatase activity
MEFSFIPPGSFLMGSDHPEGQDDEKPVHRVTLTKGFFLGAHPVTQAQWKAITGESPSSFKGDNRPVENVSWDDCQAFCQKLTAHLGGRGAVGLPSEAEWEYACRAGTTTEFHFGDTITPDQVNYNGQFTWNESPKGKYREETTEVGSFPANPWGLFDMHGNVWEWCQDWYGPYSIGEQIDTIQLTEQSNEYRVLRGGCWYGFPGGCRSAYRDGDVPAIRDYFFGVRCSFRLD